MATFVEMDTAGEPEGITRSYMHVFYALPDGSALAFFTLEQDLHGAQPVEAINSFHHHLALEVANLDAVNEVRNRYERAGQTHRVIDHGYCYSLYSSDPDGLTVEVTCNVPATREIMDERKKTAHEDMRAWVGGARHLNNHWRHPAAT
jgi:catechol-2,3-dioxygenase